MADAVSEFFDRLGQVGGAPALRRASATVRFDLTEGTRTERWLVAIDRGDVSVSRRNAKADCVVRADVELFADIVTGRVNAMTALLRGQFVVDGDPTVLVLFQRLFPGRHRPSDRSAVGAETAESGP